MGTPTLADDRALRRGWRAQLDAQEVAQALDVPSPAAIRRVDPARPIECYRLASTHAEDLRIAYVPQQRLLFVADLFGPDPAPYEMELPGDDRRWAGELYTAVTHLGLAFRPLSARTARGTAMLADVKAGGGL